MKTPSKETGLFPIVIIIFLSFFVFSLAAPVSAEEVINILSTDLFGALHPGGPNTFNQILIDKNPAWADFQQEDHGKIRTAGVILHESSFGPELGMGVNPAVVLVTYGVKYDWQLPPGGDLVSVVKQIRDSLFQYELEWFHDKVDRSQYPPIANGATYSLYRFFNGNRKELEEWSVEFSTVFEISPIQSSAKVFTLSNINNVQPFLQSPIPRPYGRDFFYHLSSFFDHQYPLYSQEGGNNRTNFRRFEGTFYEGIPAGSACGSEGDLGAGTYCYSGHPALDYPVYLHAPVRAAANGIIISCIEEWGALYIQHENGINTSYFHMDPLEIPDGVACQDVDIEHPSVNQGDIIGRVSNKNSSNNPDYGIHLHFGVGYEATFLERENIDPFGWWGDGPDPWENFQSPDYTGFESKWLWLGDERGDGYHVVDNSETQAQLFPASGGDWNWVESGYPESEGDAWYAHLTYETNPQSVSIYWGIWGTNITEPGVYQPQAYWPSDPDPNSDPVPAKNVVYTLYYHNQLGAVQSRTLYADQSRNANQFVSLCAVPYENEPGGCPDYPNISFGVGPSVVILNDVSDVPVERGKYMVFFDAIKWEEVIPTPSPTPPTPTPPPGTTITVQVDQGNEDAGIQPNLNCAFLTNDNEIYIGKCNNGTLITSGFRFGNVPIPPGVQIQEAYLEFTVDGTYTVPVSVLISGEDSGDAQPFSVLNQPADRPQTSAGAAWNIPASEAWYLGDIHRGPEMKAVVQEIVDRPDWASGQGMAFILDTLSSDPGHRRVIGYERPITSLNNYPGTEHAARLVVTFIEGTPPTPTPPTPTPPTPTPPTPTPPTPTPPTPTPEPGPICFLTGNSSAKSSTSLKTGEIPRDDGTPTIDALSISERLVQAVDLAEFAQLLYQVRDEYLSQTEAGQHYIALFKEHTTEIAYILFDDPDLYQQGYDVIKSFEAHLQALVDGEGGTVTITSEQVSDLEAILDGVAAKASPDLLSAIQAERENYPLEELIGLSMEQAWDHLNGVNLKDVILVWLPPVSKADPYQANTGSTIPLKFRIETLEGEFVEDQSVLLKVVNEAGVEVLGPFGLGDNPSQGITIQGKQYHLNLETKDLEPGLYTVEVYYSIVEPGEPAVWNLDLTDKK